MEQVRDGDPSALGELFERHHQSLYRFFVRMTGDRVKAEDLVQEVFVRMLKYGHTFRSSSEFGPWMFALARHAAVDLHRRGRKHLSEDPEAPEQPATGPQPIEALQSAERLQQLNRALAGLSVGLRDALLLARFSELKYAEIGDLLGISEGAVKARVHRAVGELKAAYRVRTEEER
jgi:RNA polymerase sigma-70 factor (ECF subfamily)